MVEPKFNFEGFAPDRSALFDLMRARVDDAMLRIIANADYGAGFDDYYAGLRAAMQTGEFGGDDLKWGWPALSIAMFSDYFETPERCRVGRLFLASAILRSEGDRGRIYDESSDETLVVVENSASLGGDYVEAAIHSLAWCGTRPGNSDQGRVLMSLAILVLWPYATNAVERLRRPATTLVNRVQAWTEPLLEDHLSRFGSVGWQEVFRASGERVRELATEGIVDRETVTRYRKLVERIEEFRE